MQQALDALEIYGANSPDVDQTITALRERLAQPEQELVCVCGAIWEGQELVSTPPPRQWVGLSRNEAMEIVNSLVGQDWMYAVNAIEAKLREKNT
jgi:hypothetical protein